MLKTPRANSRAGRAATLYNTLCAGGGSFGDTDAYRIWVSTWVLNQLRGVVPELRHAPIVQSTWRRSAPVTPQRPRGKHT